jgi:Fe2+ or Zn2+ uptake regulation protein
MKIYDTQKGEYVKDKTIEELYYVMLEGTTCECGQGYDSLDDKDDTMKCETCKRLNNIESISIRDMKEDLEETYGFRFEE